MMTPEKRAERVKEIEQKLTIKELLSIVATRCGNPNVWFIISALRGPDTDNFKLKWLTTSRIRGILNASDNWIFVNKTPLSLLERKKRDLLLAQAPAHFAQHYALAVNAIHQIYNYNLTTEQEVIR